MSNRHSERASLERLEDRRLLSATGAADDPAAPAAEVPPAAEAPLDTGGPQVVSVRVVGGPFYADAIQITFSEPLNPGRATNRENYIVGGKFVGDADYAFLDELPDDGGDPFFDADDVRLKLPIDEAIYDGSENTVTLIPERDFSVLRSLRVIKIRSGDQGIKDLAGNTLDGDEDGQPGGVAVTRYKTTFGKNVKYVDQDGDRVKLSLRGGGRVFVLQELNPHRNASSGQAIQVWLTERVKVTSVLRGSVAPTSRGGDGRASIRELLWTEPAQLDILDDERFTFDEVSR